MGPRGVGRPAGRPCHLTPPFSLRGCGTNGLDRATSLASRAPVAPAVEMRISQSLRTPGRALKIHGQNQNPGRSQLRAGRKWMSDVFPDHFCGYRQTQSPFSIFTEPSFLRPPSPSGCDQPARFAFGCPSRSKTSTLPCQMVFPRKTSRTGTDSRQVALQLCNCIIATWTREM